MLKWIILIFVIYIILGIYIANTSKNTPISKQIDVKTMSLKNPDYIFYDFSTCNGNCTDYESSSSSSWGGGSSSGK